MNSRFIHSLSAATVAFTLIATPAMAQRDKGTLKANDQVFTAFVPVVAEPSKSTVEIHCDGKQVALGTIVDSKGYILTKASELGEKPLVKVKGGLAHNSTLVGIYDPYDLALLKIDAEGLTAVKWAKSKDAEVGNLVAAPGIGRLPLQVGVVSVGTRRVTARDLPRSVNTKGGYLGVSLEPGDAGVRITRVQPGTAAAKAGFEAGDEILEVDGKAITPDVEALIKRIQKYKPNDKVTIVVDRDGESKKFEPKLGKRPAELNRGEFQNRLGSRLSDRRNGFPMILQHDLVIKPEECGGPLVDLDGRAIGINIARAGRTESYAAPSEEVQKVLPNLIAGKYAPKKEDE